ncbi:MAG: phosphoribosylanthranilate isomerase [Saprospiraceae bacterium]|nr:phosphoribosylanthranilate isomerase [Saprospiraceae bacterium]
MKIKICGMKNVENIHQILALQPDWMGFIFYPFSPRNVEEDLASEIHNVDWSHTNRVGVFVESDLPFILRKAELFNLNWIQLHGKYELSLIKELRQQFKIIKAIPVATNYDIHASEAYQDEVDMLLFDTKSALHGGSGQRFDWSVLDAYKGETSFLLSGGLSPECLKDLMHFEHPAFKGIDLNSGFELSPGIKEKYRLVSFISNLKFV